MTPPPRSDPADPTVWGSPPVAEGGPLMLIGPTVVGIVLAVLAILGSVLR